MMGSSVNESKPLIDNISADKEKSDNPLARKFSNIRCVLVVISALLSYSLASGFSFGIAASMVDSQTSEFHISLDRSSWAASVHVAVYLVACKFIIFYGCRVGK